MEDQQQQQQAPGGVVRLNVGGAKRDAQRVTLRACTGSLLDRMFDPESKFRLERVGKRVFLDMNPQVFDCIMDWLRLTKLPDPTRPPHGMRAELWQETLLYWGLLASEEGHEQQNDESSREEKRRRVDYHPAEEDYAIHKLAEFITASPAYRATSTGRDSIRLDVLSAQTAIGIAQPERETVMKMRMGGRTERAIKLYNWFAERHAEQGGDSAFCPRDDLSAKRLAGLALKMHASHVSIFMHRDDRNQGAYAFSAWPASRAGEHLVVPAKNFHGAITIVFHCCQ